MLHILIRMIDVCLSAVIFTETKLTVKNTMAIVVCYETVIINQNSMAIFIIRV